MTIRPDSRSRIRARAAARATRRLSPCHRHPDDPITGGICASCLRERLSGLDAVAAVTISSAPELRRSRSVVSTSRCEASSGSLSERRRNSCDVLSAGDSLANLFDVDDLKSGSGSEAKVESKNVGLSRVTYTVIELEKKNRERIGASGDGFGGLNAGCADSDEDGEEGEFKSMKEYIDLEFGNKSKKSKDLRDIAGNIFGAASVFSKKLRKWRQKNSKIKEDKNDGVVAGNDGESKQFGDVRKLEENHSEIVGRRSCDVEPRFSVDGGRISFEEPRASWDGYMIARTIPRLAPMFSVVENGILGNAGRFENHRLSVDGPMHSIVEDESSSGASGSGHSNSDSSRLSSFDRSSSVKSFGKKGMRLEDHGVSSPANVKLVITEKELKDWHLSSSRDDELEKLGSISRSGGGGGEGAGNMNVSAKKSVRWRKVCTVLGFRNRNHENVGETLRGDAADPSTDAAREKQAKEASELLRDVGDWKLARSSSVVASRKPCDAPGSYYARRSVDNAVGFTLSEKGDFKLERNRSTKFPSVDLDNGVTPFYMTPLRSTRNSKSGKFKLQNSQRIAGNLLQLN
ncbi:protein OCTOPUS-like [Salvia divinorum]|uniref:Protein OCTOPUS-like n=1 Tax=Salvia divinorum TaxID=28513 RepID=A0ABD1IAQ2_SALDI